MQGSHSGTSPELRENTLGKVSKRTGFVTMRVGVVAALVVVAGCTGSPQPEDGTSGPIEIATISTRADRVSGGNVLVSVRVPFEASWRPETADPPPAIRVEGRDATADFQAGESPGTYMGLLTGLTLGRNEIIVSGDAWGLPDARLSVTNYPSSGPIVSGPHLQPFICQTEDFTLPDGSRLGPPLDADCAVATRVDHVYWSSEADGFRPLPPGAPLPPDVARTTTTEGLELPFVLRVETGSMNRGVYQNVVLHNPLVDPEPSPFAPPPGWNRRLIAVHGVGCPTGWYRQGAAMGVNPLGGANVDRLGAGYALFTNTLNHPTNSCNAFLAGETTMMGKEHFIETFGVPDFTVSTGGSGGAYTSLQVADAFPGLFDGVLITSTFPDALSIALAGLDGHLLTHYFAETAPGRFTDEQKVAITGYSSVRAFEDAANQSQRTDPVPGREDVPGYSSARWHASIPEELRYHPESNPSGARPTVFDVARNIYGVDPSTGFALRPFDNVGVQYGLAALNSGAITPTDFLDLNEDIGGYDQDANYVAQRSEGDAGAIRRAYQSGVTLGGGGGLASIPVFDAGGYNDASSYHYQWFHFAVRERMQNENGRSDNHLMWRGSVPGDESWSVLIDWVAAIAADGSPIESIEKVISNRPSAAVDGCWIPGEGGAPARFVAEPQTFSHEPDSACNEALPSYSFTRQAAGGGLDGNILKCTLRPIDPDDYAVSFSDAEMARLRTLFPDGVCDWSRAGAEQVPVVPWASFGPAPENLVFDITAR